MLPPTDAGDEWAHTPVLSADELPTPVGGVDGGSLSCRRLRCSSSFAASTDRSCRRLRSTPYQNGAPRLSRSAVIRIPARLRPSNPARHSLRLRNAGSETAPASERKRRYCPFCTGGAALSPSV